LVPKEHINKILEINKELNKNLKINIVAKSSNLWNI